MAVGKDGAEAAVAKETDVFQIEQRLSWQAKHIGEDQQAALRENQFYCSSKRLLIAAKQHILSYFGV